MVGRCAIIAQRFFKEFILTTPSTPRKRIAATKTAATTSVSATKAPVRKTVARTVATKAAVQRKPRTVAAKPVANIVEKNLKPVVAKKAPVAVKRQPVVAATKSNVAKPVPVKKQKLVRDSFSFPAHEHAALADLKKRAKNLGKEFKKSEILRAGIAHLVAMADAVLVAALDKVERVKTGRPAKKGKKK